MKTHPARWTVLLLACALVAACQDRREPVKPTVAHAAGTCAQAQA